MLRNRMMLRIIAGLHILLFSGTVVSAAQQEKSVHVRFVVVGDYQPEIIRTPDAAWHRVFPSMLRDFGKLEPKPQFLIFVGDIVAGNSGKSMQCTPEVYDLQYKHFLDVLKVNLDVDIPFYPVVGNHDYHRCQQGGKIIHSGPRKYAQYMFPFIPSDAAPENKPYYSFRRGNAHLVVVCTGLFGNKRVSDFQDLVYGGQYEWLAADLARASAIPEIEHILVFGHHPFYPLVNGIGAWDGLAEVQHRIWKGLFARYGVKAYFHGHEQFYDRSTHESIAMIDVGGAGALERPGHREQRVNHYAVVDIQDSRVTISIYLPGHKLYESFDLDDLRKGRLAPPHQALANRYRALMIHPRPANPPPSSGRQP